MICSYSHSPFRNKNSITIRNNYDKIQLPKETITIKNNSNTAFSVIFYRTVLTEYVPPFCIFYSIIGVEQTFFCGNHKISSSVCYNISSCQFVQKTADGYALGAHKSNMSKGGGDAYGVQLCRNTKPLRDIFLPWLHVGKKHRKRTKIAAPVPR